MPASTLTAVRVRVEVERMVYVEASTPAEARTRAGCVTDWVDADLPHFEDTSTVRVVRDQHIIVDGESGSL